MLGRGETEATAREEAQGVRREPRDGGPHQGPGGEAQAGPGVEQGRRRGEGLRGVRSGGCVSCLFHLKSTDRWTDRQTDREEVQKEMAKKHVEKVKGEGGTGAGQYVPLRHTHTTSCPFISRKECAPVSGTPWLARPREAVYCFCP